MFKNTYNRAVSFVNARKHSLLAGAGAIGTALSASAAHATATLDFTAVSTAVTAELSPAITAAMPIAGIILASGIGWKLYKRFTK